MLRDVRLNTRYEIGSTTKVLKAINCKFKSERRRMDKEKVIQDKIETT